jgi:hypothetical protein
LTELFADGKIERVFYEFDEPLPFERDEINRERATREVITVSVPMHEKFAEYWNFHRKPLGLRRSKMKQRPEKSLIMS